MFQRLKGFNLDSFLESKIAEDEAKKAQQQAQSSSRPGSARRTPSSARRSGARSGTPSGRREGSRLRVPDGESPLPVKSPDPEEFVIGDDASDISRAATPRPVREGEDGPILEEKTETSQQDGDIASTTPSPEGQDVTSTPTAAGKEKAVPTEDELPLEVRRKLAKLDTLTTKYQGMHMTLPLHRD